MSGPFRENIKQLVEKLDGGVAAVLMGFDGISVDSFAKAGYDGALPDIQTLAMEFAHLVGQTRRTVQSLDAGVLEEVTIRTDSLTLVIRLMSKDYFLACAMLPSAVVGKARYLVKLTAPQLQAEL